MKKRLLSLALSLVMLLGAFSAIPVTASDAEPSVASSYTDVVTMTTLYNGTKTVVKNTVYSIESVDELYYFAELCTIANDYFAGATVILTKNITMNEGWTASATAPTVANAKTWTPIAMFKGTLDGQNHTVSGFYSPTGADWKKVEYVAGTNSGSGEQAGGIFCTVGGDGVTIKNLKVTNSYFCSNTYSGAIAGWVHPKLSNKDVAFENIHVNATVKAATLNGAGGIVSGTHSTVRSNAVSFKDCTFSGSVTAKGVNAGGMVGIAFACVSLENCVNNGEISILSTANDSSGISPACVGGLVGQASCQGTISVRNCTNNGKVYTSTVLAGALVGGIMGYTNVATTFTNCVNNGELYASAATANVNIGGIVARGYNKVTMDQCVNNGDLYTEVAKASTRLGGLLGYTDQTFAATDCVNTGTISMKRGDAIKDTKIGTSQIGGIAALIATIPTLTRCANLGDIFITPATTVANSGEPEIGGIIGCAKGNGMTLTDCLFAGDINAPKSPTGGVVGTYQRANGIWRRCVVVGTITAGGSGNNETYKGAFVANFNNSNNLVFEDCAYSSSLRAIPTWVEKNASLTEFTITVRLAGEEDVVTTYTAGVNPVAVQNLLYANCAKQVSSMTDLNAIKNLTALDWTDEENGWKIEEWDGNYLPMPVTVANMIGEEKTEKANGVDYHGVQYTKAADGVFSARFVSTVDDLQRGKIGFEVFMIKDGSYASYTLEDGTVYTALTYSTLVDGSEKTDFYEVEGKYLGALVFEGIPAEGVVAFEVVAFSETDGTRSYDDAYVVVFENGVCAYSYQK